MTTTHHLDVTDVISPLSGEAVQRLRAGDLVTLTGDVILCAGMTTHERIASHVQAGQPLPIDLHGASLLHLGSYSEETPDGFRLRYLNPTTSTRFNGLMPDLIRRLGLRVVGGKGGLDAACVQTMRDTGCVYLSFLGGGCTLLSQALRQVQAVAWADLVPHYRLVKVRVERLGPATVGIDAHGNSLYQTLADTARQRLEPILADLARQRADTA